MIRSSCIAAAGLAFVLLAGCSKNIQNNEAVRQGVLNYLSKRPGLLDMDVSVTSVSYRQDEATAQVHFQAKGNSAPGAGMNMQYVLERQDGAWVVKGKTGANSEHGANGQLPTGPPSEGAAPGGSPGPLDGMPSIPGAGAAPSGAAGPLPPGHPAVGSGQALPPGHPAIPDQQK